MWGLGIFRRTGRRRTGRQVVVLFKFLLPLG